MAPYQFQSIAEFYPYYLSEHRKSSTRTMHFIGTALLIACFIYALVTQQWMLLLLVPLLGYGFAWVSHAFIERNKPATFTYPLFSLQSDFIMFWHMLTGKISGQLAEAEKKYPVVDK
ncbi:MAG: DUF962 domain-containing protein [Chitinophagales bacterium]